MRHTSAQQLQAQQLGHYKADAVKVAPIKPVRAAASEVQEKPKQEEKFDARAFRRSLNKTGRYIRQTKNDPNSI